MTSITVTETIAQVSVTETPTAVVVQAPAQAAIATVVAQGPQGAAGSYQLVVDPVVSAASVAPASDKDLIDITAQAVPLTVNNPSYTPVNCRRLLIRIKDDGSAHAITWGSAYASFSVLLPTSTVPGQTMLLGFMYNTSISKWQLTAYSVG